ncbi:hypothetical protein BJ508DRAFT_335582 [Ascobolus immersus RN42]|uniref:Uncharacterized protein n=1 Tax=Ascobolus immersus RN42 TaxID=1160509 RepID=A0A3N4HBU6_ASCIM|nr:hypothetical protein BJ508DRAFT_335582 [Ascobolus immersus RN42]
MVLNRAQYYERFKLSRERTAGTLEECLGGHSPRVAPVPARYPGSKEDEHIVAMCYYGLGQHYVMDKQYPVNTWLVDGSKTVGNITGVVSFVIPYTEDLTWGEKQRPGFTVMGGPDGTTEYKVFASRPLYEDTDISPTGDDNYKFIKGLAFSGHDIVFEVTWVNRRLYPNRTDLEELNDIDFYGDRWFAEGRGIFYCTDCPIYNMPSILPFTPPRIALGPFRIQTPCDDEHSSGHANGVGASANSTGARKVSEESLEVLVAVKKEKFDREGMSHIEISSDDDANVRGSNLELTGNGKRSTAKTSKRTTIIISDNESDCLHTAHEAGDAVDAGARKTTSSHHSSDSEADTQTKTESLNIEEKVQSDKVEASGTHGYKQESREAEACDRAYCNGKPEGEVENKGRARNGLARGAGCSAAHANELTPPRSIRENKDRGQNIRSKAGEEKKLTEKSGMELMGHASVEERDEGMIGLDRTGEALSMAMGYPVYIFDEETDAGSDEDIVIIS